MVMAAMIAMFYLGTASGVMGAVLVGTRRSQDAAVAPSFEGTLLGAQEPALAA